MKYSYYAGCTIPYRENSYELSTRKVLEKLGVELLDMEGAGCCGYFIEQLDRLSWLALAAQVICISEEKGLDILTLCSGCHGSLAKVNHILKNDPEVRGEVNDILVDTGMEFKGNIEIKHLVRILTEDLGTKKVGKAISVPFDGLNVAAHYGCHFLKPSDVIAFDDPESPTSLDELVNLTGAKSIQYMDRMICCGSPLVAIDMDLALQIGRMKLENAKKAGANAIVTACPFCHIMYDLNQLEIQTRFNETYDLPALHYPQLLGLAMGLGFEELGLHMNRVDATKIMEFLRK